MEKNDLYQILHEIQKGLIVEKSQKNPYGNYNYRTAESILREAKRLMPEGVFINMTDEIIPFGERLMLKATVALSTSAGAVTSIGFAELDRHKGMSAEQCVGSACSYARKYALCGLFAVDDSKSDPDTMDNTSNGYDAINRMVELCDTEGDLLKLWKGLQEWQSDEQVKALFSNRKNQLKK